MKRFTLVCTLALAFMLLAAVPALAQASPTVEYQRYAYDAVSTNYCTNEPVHYQGFYETRIVTTYSPAGVVTRVLWYHQRLEGVGLDTGTTYSLQAHYQEAVTTTIDSSGIRVVTFPISYIEVSRGPAGDYRSTGLMHVTTNATGDQVVSVELGRATCVGG
jgi:hypothetical protein